MKCTQNGDLRGQGKWEMGALKFSGLKNMVNIAQADLKLLIFLPKLSKGLELKAASPRLTQKLFVQNSN